MSRKAYTYNFTGMTTRELLQAYDQQMNRIELAVSKGNANHARVHRALSKRVLDEYFARIESGLDDWGDNPLDRRELA